jgi:hypothetical protein
MVPCAFEARGQEFGPEAGGGRSKYGANGTRLTIPCSAAIAEGPLFPMQAHNDRISDRPAFQWAMAVANPKT